MWDLSIRGGELQSDQKSNLQQNQGFFLTLRAVLSN